MGPCRKPTLDRSAPLGFSAALLLLASLTATQADAQTTPLTTPLTLAQAQRLLVTSSPELRLERLGTDKAEAQVSEARSAYWPSLDVFGSYQALTEKNHIAITLPPPSNTHIDRTMGDYDREEYAVDLTLPLFGGGARRQQVLSRTAAGYATQAGTQAQENALALRLAATYCAWHSADAAGKVQGEVATRYRDYAERVTAQVKQGAALPSQASTARARWLNAQAELQAAQDNRDSIGRAAALLLGLSPETPVTFAAEAPAASLVTSGLTSAATRPDLLALDRSAESLDHQQSGLIGQRFPSLTGMVGYRLANPGLNLGTNDYMHYGVFGLQARWNLFDGFRNRSQRAQLEAQQASVRVDKERRSAAWTRTTGRSRCTRERTATA